VSWWAARLAAAALTYLVRVAARVRDDIVFYVPTDLETFALTFDDGPDPALTPAVLDVLNKHQAQATFFLVGSRAKAHPDLVRRVRQDGHEIGNHMWLEERASALSDQEFERSMLMTWQVLGEVGNVYLLRPGSGLVGRQKVRIAERHHHLCVLGSVYPFDAQIRCSRFASLVVRALLEPGAIVILHEVRASRSGVLDVLDEVLHDARRRGLTPVSVGRLLEQRTAAS
jgi:peptidoglycan/xylan/chitin deacetylase (PgdA/CDA1 family)